MDIYSHGVYYYLDYYLDYYVDYYFDNWRDGGLSVRAVRVS